MDSTAILGALAAWLAIQDASASAIVVEATGREGSAEAHVGVRLNG